MFFYLYFVLTFLISDSLTNQIEQSSCNQQYYVKPQCIDRISNYKCRCNPGFIWNGEKCVTTALNSYFEFKTRSTKNFVILDKTFPKLSAFTISTWLQIHNYSATINNADELFKGDFRTIFSYSIDNYANVIRLQVASTVKSIMQTNKRINVRLSITLSILQSVCNANVEYTYKDNFFWIHLALTWHSKGIVEFYIDGEFKSSCTNIAKDKEINTAGDFIIGQTKQEMFQLDSDEKLNKAISQLNSSRHLNNTDTKGAKNYNFDPAFSFIGRLFNFNVWDYAKNLNSILNLYLDCKLTECGNATQWSDFRQGTRGDVKLKWPTNLLWKDECLDEKFQFQSCNNYCDKEIGPICREIFEKNFYWPSSKAGQIIQLPCSSSSSLLVNAITNQTRKHASKKCSFSEKKYIKQKIDKKAKLAIKSRRNKEDFEEPNDEFNRKNYFSASWNPANIDECIQEPLLSLRNEIYQFQSTDNFDETHINVYTEKLLEVAAILLRSPTKTIHDVSAVFDSLTYLINAQQQSIAQLVDINFNLNIEDIKKFAKLILQTIDILLNVKDSDAWSKMKPIGSESIKITSIVNELARCLYVMQQYIHHQTKNNFYEYDKLTMNQLNYNLIEFKLNHIFFRQQYISSNTNGAFTFDFPDWTKTINDDSKSKKVKQKHEEKKKKPKIVSTSMENDPEKTNLKKSTLPSWYSQSNSRIQSAKISFDNAHFIYGVNHTTEPYALLLVYYSGLEELLPSHNKTFRPKDNNLNAMILTLQLINKNGLLDTRKTHMNLLFDKQIKFYYEYKNNFNISDTRCVNLEELNEKQRVFKWARQNCSVYEKNATSVTCVCNITGTFSITNDLYDPNWMPVIKENVALTFPSYLGCIVVSLFGLATYFCLTYFKTKSTTTSIHKNLCISICMSQLLIMISLSNIDYDQNLCQIFSLINHYLLFVVFAWLMNEAFNLYITITYAAHQITPVNDTGPQWRFYLIGWFFPGLMVVILLVSKQNTYYDKKLCLFNLENLWINVSPMLAMLAITFLVMIFSAKEHTESSYTKNEKANKLITNHTKAVWTEFVLLAVCWMFFLMSLVIYGSLIKYLFAFLNCLQGSFLFIYYFLLNEEVRKYLKESKKKSKKIVQKDSQIMINNLHGLISKKQKKVQRQNSIESENQTGQRNKSVQFEHNPLSKQETTIKSNRSLINSNSNNLLVTATSTHNNKVITTIELRSSLKKNNKQTLVEDQVELDELNETNESSSDILNQINYAPNKSPSFNSIEQEKITTI